MPNDCVTYQKSGCFSNLIVDYLNQKEKLQPLYNRFPTLENFKFQIFKVLYSITVYTRIRIMCQ